MKCKNCKTELFDKDIVHNEKINMIYKKDLYAHNYLHSFTSIKKYRCPKCFKVKIIKKDK